MSKFIYFLLLGSCCLFLMCFIIFFSPIQAVGHKKISVSVPMNLDEIGVYYRGGRVYPAQEAAMNTLASRTKPFQFIVALDDSQAATGDLYWDNGDSIGKICDP